MNSLSSQTRIETFRFFNFNKLRIRLLCIGMLCMLGISLTIPAQAQVATPHHPPVKDSSVIVGFEWIGNEFQYPAPAPEETKKPDAANSHFAKNDDRPHGDTFPMTWADDGEIYASAGDPAWGGKYEGLDVEKFSGMPPGYTITRINSMAGYKGTGGSGTKPSGMISVNGVLYLAFQNLLGAKPPAHGPQDQGQGKETKISQHGSDAMIVHSNDYGKTWEPAIENIKVPMFPGSTFGGPAFVNNGKNNANAPDGYIYAVSTDQWDNGDNLRVGRVPADRIQDRAAWEWISELKDPDHPVWSSNLQQAVPVFSDNGHISLPDEVYIAGIKRYILLTWSLKLPFSPYDGTELDIYDAPHPWGPFTLVHHEDLWESMEMTPYCPRLPLKWLQVKPHELDGWIQFSGSWRTKHYRSHVRQFRMKLRQ